MHDAHCQGQKSASPGFQVRWRPNPWGDATVAEISEGCAGGSDSCVRFSNLGQWNGFHLYYRQSFPVSTFASLSLELRATSGGGEVVVAPSHDGERCAETTVTVGDEWTPVEIDVAASCTELTELNAVTVSNSSSTMVLLVDEVRFE